MGTSEWNRVLTALTTAPNRLRHPQGDRHQAPDGPDSAGDPEDAVRRLAGAAAPGSRLRTVSRLVAARWLYNDRLFDPRRRLARLLAREYYELAQLTTEDSNALQGSGQELGASGPIELAADYTLSTVGSNPVNKVVPILRWTPRQIEFVKLEN